MNDSLGWICEAMDVNPIRRYTGGERGWVGDSPFIFLDCAPHSLPGLGTEADDSRGCAAHANLPPPVPRARAIDLMPQRICVYGLWHLGCVTAACLAATGFDVTGLDLDRERVQRLSGGEPPVAEPGLSELLLEMLTRGSLRFTHDANDALEAAEVLLVAFDTPVDENDEADVGWVRSQLETIRPQVRPGTLILITSQVPVGFSRQLEDEWGALDSSLSFAYSPENLRLGHAIEAFRFPERIVVGLGKSAEPSQIEPIFGELTDHLVWMSLESAEMTKHAINAFLAMSVVYANELGRVCEQVGADSREVELGLRSEPRIGERAYVSAGPAIAGGTLARDVVFLTELARTHGVETPVFQAIQQSNVVHRRWTQGHLDRLLREIEQPAVALLGLTYKAGTDTLRRSSAVELGHWLLDRGVRVQAFDPAIHQTLPEIAGFQVGRASTRRYGTLTWRSSRLPGLSFDRWTVISWCHSCGGHW